MAHPSQELDGLFHAVADDHVDGLIVIPPDADWLYHPYHGEADVMAASPEARDLREKFQSWAVVSPARPLTRAPTGGCYSSQQR